MLNLYVIRHATTEGRSVDGTDAARRLTETGHLEVRRVARSFGPSFRMLDTICHSPRTRACETAAGLAELLALTDRLRSEAVLDCGGPLAEQVKLVEGFTEEGVSNAAWIAHEPEVSHLVSWFLGLDSVRLAFDPAAVAHLEFFGRPRRGGALLRAFCPPRCLPEETP